MRQKHPDFACQSAVMQSTSSRRRSVARRRPRFAPSSVIGSGSVASYTAGLMQLCGVEHRRASGHRLGQHVAAGIGRSAHRLFGCADAGEPDRVGEVDPYLEHLCFGLEHRDEAGCQIFGGKKLPAVPQMQPIPSVDLVAQCVSWAPGRPRSRSRRIRGTRNAHAVSRDLRLTGRRRSPGSVRPATRRCSSAETSSVSVRWQLDPAPATRLTVTSASPWTSDEVAAPAHLGMTTPPRALSAPTNVTVCRNPLSITVGQVGAGQQAPPQRKRLGLLAYPGCAYRLLVGCAPGVDVLALTTSHVVFG